MSATASPGRDDQTARAFAGSWNHVGHSTVYSREQFLDWFQPLGPSDLEGRSVIELGFGNGSLLFHVASAKPARIAGVELGDTLAVAQENLSHVPASILELRRGDMTSVDLGLFDVVFCIGVLHHLEDPQAGFRSVLRHTRPGGRFHCWVYAHEGNALVRLVVEPLRRVTSRLPWWVTKYCVATPLVVPYFAIAKTLRAVIASAPSFRQRLAWLPLIDYSLWIAERPFWFFQHVAFDQLVTPRTRYLSRDEVAAWLESPEVEPNSTYLIFRNGNSWKFGGCKRSA